MSKAQMLSKGQITIPLDVREELQVHPGDVVEFVISALHEVKIMKGIENEHSLNSKALITEKGQVTIPKDIREALKLEKGDTLLFTWINHSIFISKQGDMLLCPACKGTGTFEDYKLPCFVCDQTGLLEKQEQGILFSLFFKMKFRKYSVGSTITQSEIGENGFIQYREFPKLTLRSNTYPSKLLNTVQDTLQLLIVKDYAPKSISTSEKFMIPSDSILESILELFVTAEAKDKVKDWFR